MMPHIEPIDSLSDIWIKVTDQLNRLKTERGISKLMVVGTLSENKEPEIRTLVLRDVIFNPLAFLFFTDLRSPKVQELALYPKVTMLHYDTSLKRQLRCKAHAGVINDSNMLAKYWEDYNVKEKDYSTILAPGTEISSSELILKDDKSAFKNFGVIQLNVQQVEVLELGKENHFRARYLLGKDGTSYEASWLVP
jgi:pyridoxamine 5'-phosphate oxidase